MNLLNVWVAKGLSCIEPAREVIPAAVEFARELALRFETMTERKTA
ncbi:MAG: hypothetical protein OXC05_07785 [Halieaceae bacterium]|nr:hypothetical protein [Halieaceae bacterium]